MKNTELLLDIHKGFNLKTMAIVDHSHYCDDDVVENYLIEVLAVNRKDWVVFHVQKNFNLILNSSNLGYKRVDTKAQLTDIPDGIYEFRQSYKPNVHTMAHYIYLRTTALQLKYVEVLCSHFANECKKDAGVYNEETMQLAKIKQYIDAAEYAVSEKHEKETGVKYYNKAVELIKQFEHECVCW